MLNRKITAPSIIPRFPQFIRNNPIDDDGIMVSCDVTFLNTNIRIMDTLNIMKDCINIFNQFTRKTAIPQDKFLDLVNLVLTTAWYTFNSRFYQQTVGVAKGGPASSINAEIYVQAHENTAVSTALQLLKFEEFLMYALGKFFASHQQSSSKY